MEDAWKMHGPEAKFAPEMPEYKGGKQPTLVVISNKNQISQSSLASREKLPVGMFFFYVPLTILQTYY